MFKKIKSFVSYAILFILGSCLSVSDFSGNDVDVEPADEVGQLLSDIQQEEEQMSLESNEYQSLETAEEKLEPTPQKEYDSVLIDDTDEKVDEQLATQVEEQETILPTTKLDDFESTISKLSINDKIQYRVATINFYSGSSQVNGAGLKKIRKIAKIAKERNAKIKIVGHASKRTRDMPLAKHKLVNFNISDKRAQSVANVFIQKYSFPSYNLITEAVSDTKPLFKENMPAGTKANQRTEIFLIY